MDFEITDINVTAATIRFRNKSNEDGRLKKGPFLTGLKHGHLKRTTSNYLRMPFGRAIWTPAELFMA